MLSVFILSVTAPSQVVEFNLGCLARPLRDSEICCLHCYAELHNADSCIK